MDFKKIAEPEKRGAGYRIRKGSLSNPSKCAAIESAIGGLDLPIRFPIDRQWRRAHDKRPIYRDNQYVPHCTGMALAARGLRTLRRAELHRRVVLERRLFFRIKRSL